MMTHVTSHEVRVYTCIDSSLVPFVMSFVCVNTDEDSSQVAIFP